MDKSWRVIFAFIGIFVAGAVTGVLLAPRIFNDVVERRTQRGPSGSNRPPAPAAQAVGPQLFRRIAEQLNLTAEQKEKIKPIEQRSIEEFRSLRRETQHNTQVALEKMQAEISAILTPEQLKEFEARIAEGRERIRKLQEGEGKLRREPGGLFNRLKDRREGAPQK